jgi:hypothetical protein
MLIVTGTLLSMAQQAVAAAEKPTAIAKFACHGWEDGQCDVLFQFSRAEA